MRVNTYLIVSGAIFALVGGLHALRLVYDWPAIIGLWRVPMTLSWVAAPISLAICLWAIILLRRRR